MDTAKINGTAIIPKITAIFTKSFFSSGLNLPIISHYYFGIFLIHVVNSREYANLDLIRGGYFRHFTLQLYTKFL